MPSVIPPKRIFCEVLIYMCACVSMDVRSSMLSGYQPRRVVREREREIPSEVDSKLIRELLMEVVPRGGPHRRPIPRRLENPEEADHTNQRMYLSSALGVLASLLLRRVMFFAENDRLCGHACPRIRRFYAHHDENRQRTLALPLPASAGV